MGDLFVNNRVYIGLDNNLFDANSIAMIEKIIVKEVPSVEVCWMKPGDYQEFDVKIRSRVVKWREEQDVIEWKNKPENLKSLMSFANKLYYISNGDWFTQKQIVGSKVGDHKEVKRIIDLLYITGYVAERKLGNLMQYKVIPNASARLSHVEWIIADKENDLKELMEVRDRVLLDSLEFQSHTVRELDGKLIHDIKEMNLEELKDLIKEKQFPIGVEGLELEQLRHLAVQEQMKLTVLVLDQIDKSISSLLGSEPTFRPQYEHERIYSNAIEKEELEENSPCSLIEDIPDYDDCGELTEQLVS